MHRWFSRLKHRSQEKDEFINCLCFCWNLKVAKLYILQILFQANEGLERNSLMKRMLYSDGGPELNSQHPSQEVRTTCNSCFAGSDTLLWTAFKCTHPTQMCTSFKTQKDNLKWEWRSSETMIKVWLTGFLFFILLQEQAASIRDCSGMIPQCFRKIEDNG